MSPHVRFNCQTAKWIRAKWIRLCIPAARDARVVHQTCPSEDRGRREGRVLGSHPRPVCIGRKHTVVTTGGAGSSGLPCAMVLTASFELSPVTSSFLPPSPRRLQTHPTPGWADIVSARLDTSNGCQDHTTSPSTAAPFVRAPADRSRKLALRSPHAPTLPRPPHPALHVRDDRDTPLLSRRDTGINNADFSKSRSEIFFESGLDSDLSGGRLICPTGSFRKCNPPIFTRCRNTRSLSSDAHSRDPVAIAPYDVLFFASLHYFTLRAPYCVLLQYSSIFPGRVPISLPA